MPTDMQLPKDDPRIIAWEAYQKTDEYENTKRWVSVADNVEGSLWASFLSGYEAAIKSRPRSSEKAVARSAVEKMLRDWQHECKERPALWNQGTVLLHRLAALAIPHTGGVKPIDHELREVAKVHGAEIARHGEYEPGTIRICPMRDGPCPHGLNCPYVGDGYSGYPCKEGWRSALSGDA